MKTQQAGIDLIKSFESCRLKAYHGAADRPEVWTIGWGFTHGVKEGDEITQEEADCLLMGEIHHAEEIVNSAVKAYLNQNEFDALVCFAYNTGCIGKTMLAYLNQMRYDLAAAEFPKWVYSNGVVVKGLQRRRAAERQLFLEPI